MTQNTPALSFSDEQITAYIDSELGEEDRTALDDALATNADLRDRLALFETAGTVLDSARAALDTFTPGPEHLDRILRNARIKAGDRPALDLRLDPIGPPPSSSTPSETGTATDVSPPRDPDETVVADDLPISEGGTEPDQRPKECPDPVFVEHQDPPIPDPSADEPDFNDRQPAPSSFREETFADFRPQRDRYGVEDTNPDQETDPRPNRFSLSYTEETEYGTALSRSRPRTGLSDDEARRPARDATAPGESWSDAVRKPEWWVMVAGIVIAFALGTALTYATRPSPSGQTISRPMTGQPMDTSGAMVDASRDWKTAVAAYAGLYGRHTLMAMTTPHRDLDIHVRSIGAALRIPLTPETLVADGFTLVSAELLAFEGQPLGKLAYMDRTGTPILFCILRGPAARPIPPRMDERPSDRNEAGLPQGTLAQSTLPKASRIEGLRTVAWTKDDLGYLVIGNAPDLQIAALGDTLSARFR